MATTVIKEALRGVLAGLAAHGQAGPAASRPPLAAERGMPSRIAGVASRGFRWLARGRACAS
jgi:hypothetical protein